MPPEREVLEVDALFVGAGPASLAGSIHLARLIKKHNETAEKKIDEPFPIRLIHTVRGSGYALASRD